MPDADLDQAVDALIGAGYGSAARCMRFRSRCGRRETDALVKKLIHAWKA